MITFYGVGDILSRGVQVIMRHEYIHAAREPASTIALILLA